MADTISVDVVDMTIPAGNHRNIPVINEPNPASGVTIDANQCKQLIQISNLYIYEAGTRNIIDGNNFYDYFPNEGGGGGGGGGSAILVTKDVTANGTYNASSDHADGYSKVNVNVANTYTNEDEGKVVDNGTLSAQTSTNITSNGTVDTTLNNEVVVNVPNTYTAGDEGKVVDNGALVEQTAMAEEVIENGTVDTTLYNSVTVNVPSGGGLSSTDVVFYDYDGSVVATYSAADFAKLSAMPANPTHEGITGQGWNWSLSDAKAHVASYGKLNIGQMYVTSDGKTRLYISLPEGRISPILQLYLNASTTLDIDWGDGSTHSTFTSTSAAYKSERHEYSTLGDYVIAITVTTGSFVLQSSSSNLSSILWNGNDSVNSPDTAYNNSIKKVEIGTGVTGIDTQGFYKCYSLSSVTIPNTVTSIGQRAFQSASLTSVTIPSSVTSIGYYTFGYCYALTSVTIPSSVTSIGSGAFYWCYALTSVTIPDSITSIDDYAFNASSLSSITIPSSDPSLGSYAFGSCHSLTSITISNGVTSIDAGAFNGCDSLTSITIPNTVTSIGSKAFYDCHSLTSITIPSSVTSIGDSAFYNCYSLSSITIPSSVTTIGASAFGYCYALTSVTIPSSVTTIGAYAFRNCTGLSSITIPDTVTSIGASAFNGCNSLTSITIPDTVTSIGDSTFISCVGLSSVTIPNTVTSIGQQAFYNCYSLSSITIPSSVTTIRAYAFYYCSYMSYIKFESTTPPAVSSSNAWTGLSTSTKILVPAGTLETYKATGNYPSPSKYTYEEY